MSKQKSDSAPLLDQTPWPLVDFRQEEWWLDGKTRIKKEQTFFQTKQAKILVGVGLIVVMLTIVAVINRKPVDPPSITKETASEQILDSVQTPLQEQIRRVRAQLEEADPANKDTSLPQVETNIIISE
ncbi:MAG TPA: hypothetical protein PLM16_02085 [Candidatus Woesebacteria bacterium]|nr:hypothetical protein [Candidatus Woesebacteria bacterium]